MSNRRKTNLTAAQIEAMTLDDLLGDLDPSKLAQSAANGKGRPQRVDLLNAEAAREQAIAEAARRHRETQARISPWLPEATIICLEHVECTFCGSHSVVPAAETLMVRFRNRRDGSTWEVANHPSQLNPSLPREEKHLWRKAHACQHCFTAPEAADWYWTNVQREAQPTTGTES